VDTGGAAAADTAVQEPGGHRGSSSRHSSPRAGWTQGEQLQQTQQSKSRVDTGGAAADTAVQELGGQSTHRTCFHFFGKRHTSPQQQVGSVVQQLLSVCKLFSKTKRVVLTPQYLKNKNMSGLIDGFLPFKEFSETQKDFVRANIEQVNGQEDKTYVARASVMWGGEEVSDVYVTVDLGQAEMRATTTISERKLVEDTSWYQYTFVFIKQDDGSYETYTPVVKPRLGMHKEDEGGRVMFKNNTDAIDSRFKKVHSNRHPYALEYLWNVQTEKYRLKSDNTSGKVTFTLGEG
jgi:hypothetical protein